MLFEEAQEKNQGVTPCSIPKYLLSVTKPNFIVVTEKFD
jgi:hypothetical protein